MNALFRKEIRLLLPAWIAAMLLAIAPTWFIPLHVGHDDTAQAVIFGLFCLGALVLCLTPFGQEFSAGTFPQFLSQPVSRHRLWRVKAGVYFSAAFVALFGFSISYRLRVIGDPELEASFGQLMRSSALAALAVFTGGLWSTLLFRQVAAALWFTILIPVALLYSIAELLIRIFDFARPLPEWSLFAGLALYSIAGFLWARWQFLHAQDSQWTGGPVSLPAWLGFGSRLPSSSGLPMRKPLRALICKELQSHHVSLLIAGLLLLSHVAAIAARKVESAPSEPNNILHMLLEFWWSLWLALPLVIGSSAVAEERKLGTLESQLCQPTTPRLQLSVKLVLALVLGIFLGGFMPWLLESAGGLFDGANPIASLFSKGEFAWQRVLAIGLASAWITLISFYVSTLSRNTLQAISAAILLGLPLTGIMGWAIDASPGFRQTVWEMPLLAWFCLPMLLATLLWLAFRNYKHLHVGWNIWLRNLVTIFMMLAIATAAASTIYKRPWELLMALEPRHGPPRLSGSVRPKICVTQGFELFALLPDGRIWAAQNYEGIEVGEAEERSTTQKHTRRERKIYMPVPVDGTFLGASNWVKLANTEHHVVGIQSDGSLWNVFSRQGWIPWNRTRLLSVPEPERIGTDSNWTAIASGLRHFLALKADGTLWGWGNNREGQLGAGPKESPDEPVRIGTDSDWAAVLAGNDTSVGIKQDGSVWQWGQLNVGPNGWQGWQQGAYTEPVRWNLDGTDWVTRAGKPNFHLVLRKDGTLWAAGLLPENLLGNHLKREFTPKLMRVGHDSDWAEIDSSWVKLIAIKSDGTLFVQNNVDERSVFWADNLWKPSKHKDWIAIGTQNWVDTVALAADGTLCWWGDPFRRAGLLGPSRKPVWHLNIFVATK